MDSPTYRRVAIAGWCMLTILMLILFDGFQRPVTDQPAPTATPGNATKDLLTVEATAQTMPDLAAREEPSTPQGDRGNSQDLAVPASTILPQVSAGQGNTCVVNSAGHLTCWGVI